MKNKYYTPEIEEFHVGFEYEKAKVGIFDNIILKPEKWKKESIEINTFDEICMYNELVGNIRVKYLDEDHILDLGFEKEFSTRSEILDASCNVYISTEKNLMLAHYPSINKVTIATRDFSKSEKLLKTNWDDRQINLIQVKNKSELKKILKMLDCEVQ